MTKRRINTGKLQVTFVPETKGRPGKMFFWLPPRYEEFSVEEALAELLNSTPTFSFQDTKISLVLPASWVLKRKPKSKAPRVFNVEGKTLSVVDSITALATIESAESSHKRLNSSLKIWSLAAKFALELIVRGQMVPYLLPQSEGSFKAKWKMSLWMDKDRERFLKLTKAMPLSSHAGACREKDKKTPPAIYTSKLILQKFLDEAADSLVRYSYKAFEEKRGQRFISEPFGDTWYTRLIKSLTGSNSHFHIKGFNERYIPQLLNRWLKPAATSSQWEDYRICFRLEMPFGPLKDGEKWQIRYLLQAADDVSLLVPSEKVWKSSKKELRFLNRTFKEPQEKLLMGLAEASNIFPPLTESLKTARPSSIKIDVNKAWNFIKEAVPILQESGFVVLLPQELTRAGQRRIKARMRVGSGKSQDTGESGTGRFGLPSLIDYQWEVALGNETLSISEFKQIARLKQPLVYWRDHWVMIDPKEVTQIKELFDKATSGKLTLQEALSASLLGRREHSELQTPVEVNATGNMKALVDALKSNKTLKPIKTPSTFRGKLRPYQKRGLVWLSGMGNLGFGACLADDMGLGKTIEVIAWLLHRKKLLANNSHPVLVICPTSVLGNWQREIERFAPNLPVIRHHGLNRASSKDSLEKSFSPHTVVLTTYSLARRDKELLSQIEWGGVILDEAQNIKNPFSQQARATRQFKARNRIALTGTPVENRLSELWSIFEFLNPRFLGPLKKFKHKFAFPIERYKDPEATEKLKKLTGPFLLRRLKTDKSIITDLPEKNEMKVFCTLTQEQATLYQALLNETMEKIEKSEGMKRRGLILSLITSLKQICNHPSLYLRENASLSSRSGKLERLIEMGEEVIEEKSYALIFTQFREMGYLLARYLEKKFTVEVPFLHGGVPTKKRDEMVHSFQEDEDASPLFLISLKAGGTGLNLTRASFVFHFDRWWNPAVENQATDRAFRIGQKKNVQVYKMICLGTMEEKIDKMLEEKKELADRIISAGERWVTEMSNDKLREILTLSSESAIDSEEE
ncbi:MAG: DEAD/DEAH box helicase [Candidatus Aerophobetes bacterium]|nr:DEAD/DEAH box helicase [Candidatus Aerophobetes bacterium]